MRRWSTRLAMFSWLLLTACGGGQNQTQEPQTNRGISDNTQLGSSGRTGTAPAAVGALPAIPDVVVSGETALALGAEGLVLVDLHTPAEPKAVTTVLLSDGARRLAASGTRAYVASGDNGLKIVDLSKPRQPLIVGTYAPSTGGVELVAAEGDLVLASLGPQGVAVVDAAEPSAPVERKRLAALKNPRAVALAGRWGYVLGDKLTVLDLSKPAETSVAATFDPKDKAAGLALAGHRALLASAKQCQVIDLANPAKPSRVATLATVDLLKQFPLAKPAKTAPTADANKKAEPAKDPAVRLTAAGSQAALTIDDRTYLLALGDKALTAQGVTDSLDATTLVVAGEPWLAATAAGGLVPFSLADKAVKPLGRLSLLPAKPVAPAGTAQPAGTVPPNPPTREGQAALNAVPEPKPGAPTPTPPAAD